MIAEAVLGGALAHGVSDWEALDSTWAALATAFEASAASAEQVEAYRLALAAPGSRGARLLREGTQDAL